MKDWVCSKAKSSGSRPFGESWLLLAQSSAATDNFNNDKTAYEIQCSKYNAQEAATSLQKLYMHYSGEQEFWAEIKKLVQAFRENQKQDRETIFRQKLFSCLMPELQQSLLHELADKFDLNTPEGQTEKCQTLVLLLRKFPQSVPTFGLQLMDLLKSLKNDPSFTEEDRDGFKLLSACVLPEAILSQSSLRITDDICSELLTEALLNVLDLSLFGKQSVRPASSFLKTKIQQIGKNPFSWLLNIYKKVASKCGFPKNTVLQEFSSDEVLRTLNSLATESRSSHSSLSCTVSLIIAWLLVDYRKIIGAVPQEGKTQSRCQLVLVPFGLLDVPSSLPSPTLSITPSTRLPAKKRKYDETGAEKRRPLLLPAEDSQSKRVDQLLTMTLQALRLTGPDVRRRLGEILGVYGVAGLLADASLYGAQFEDVLGWCDSDTSEKSSPENLCDRLRKASALLVLKRNCLSSLFEGLVSDCQNQSINTPIKLADKSYYTLLPLNSYLDYTIHMCVYCLKRGFEKSVMIPPTDQLVGHLIILSQPHWMNSGRDLFASVIKSLLQRKTFEYPKLAEYIIRMEVLEELSYLQKSGLVNLIVGENGKPAGGKLFESRVSAILSETLEEVLLKFFKTHSKSIVELADF